MFKNFNKKDKNITLDDGYKKFINFCMLNKLSEYTIKNKRVTFEDFKKCIKYTDIVYCNQLTDEVIEYYKLYLTEKGNMTSTINEKICALMSIFNYFSDHGWCNKIIAKYIKKEKTMYETYTESQLQKLLEKPDIKNCSFAHYRSWVMENFFYSTGVRKRTLINIKIEDVNFDDNIIILKVVKNKQQMYIPMSLKLKEILEEYLFYREGQPNDYLFTDRFGNQLTSDVVRGAILRYNQRKGVDVEGTHRFRHNFATDYIKNGGNIVDLKHLLGHQSLDITQQYVNLLITDLKEHNNTFNPLDNFVRKQKKNKIITMKNK